MPAARPPRFTVASLGLLGVLLVGAGDFLWQLGSSSFFQDESFTVEHSTGTIGQVLHTVSTTEGTPWPYFVFIHEWLRAVNSTTDWVVRLPSAVAAIALVAATYWLARAFLERGAACLAALLVAISPFVLEYAQQARVYAFVMLAVTVSVAAVLQALGRTGRARGCFLLLGAVAAVAGLWLHYCAAAVVVPLCVWLGFQRDLSVRARGLFVGVSALALVAEIPLFGYQQTHNPPGMFPGSTGLKIVSVLETPFDGRYGAGLDVLRIIGALVVLISVVAVGCRALASSEPARSPLLLLTAVASVAPIGVFILSAAGADVLISRYAAAAAPMLLVCIVVAAAALPARLAPLLLTAAFAVAVVGVVESHQSSGFYPPTRQVVTYVRALDVTGRPVFFSSVPDPALSYYAAADLPQATLTPLSADLAPLTRVVAAHARAWIISEYGSAHVSADRLVSLVNARLGPLHYRVLALKTFRSSAEIAAYLVGPRQPLEAGAPRVR